MNEELRSEKWSENVIIVDADYVDRVAFDLIVNFERMLMRRVPQADLARWIDCIALDGGVREGNGETQIVLLHDVGKKVMENFLPADYDDEINGKAFNDNLGEFVMTAVEVPDFSNKDDMMLEMVQIAAGRKEVKRIMVIPDCERSDIYDSLRRALTAIGDDKRITLFAMQPMPGGNFRQEILGYSLMSALGIKGTELD
ncbi:DUF6621 family protein [Prevotella sp. OH937_COT-195]|uniref:DUF6621 family protein n=1 Tax=Prevotella sp. OH937_COT-195 TaxID=2491051 RepID=UPI000F64C88B|nr:DUF6621 family protein [Prevotella sp. OH937_COT-195]RRD02651.1 hypothetical protein EII32_01145 [Prevotella sp. OH937_COT-195]